MKGFVTIKGDRGNAGGTGGNKFEKSCDNNK